MTGLMWYEMIGVKVKRFAMGHTGLAHDLILESGDDLLASASPREGRHGESRLQRNKYRLERSLERNKVEKFRQDEVDTAKSE